MEKYGKLLLRIIIFLTISLSSCEKKSEYYTKDENKSRLDKDLKEINNYFSLKNIIESNEFTSTGTLAINGSIDQIPRLMTFKTFCGIFSADVGGAWAGTWAGAKIGGWGGPKGAAAGAVIGAIIVGGAASYATSYSISDPTSLINYSLEIEEELIVNIDNEESAYNGHNRVLTSLINANRTGHNELIVNNVNSSQTNSDVFTNLTTVELNFLNTHKNLIDRTLETFKSNSADIDVSKSYVNSTINDDNYLTIVSNNFFDGLKLLTKKSDILVYINQYENYFINTPNLDEIRRHQILTALEISRGSLDFWSALY